MKCPATTPYTRRPRDLELGEWFGIRTGAQHKRNCSGQVEECFGRKMADRETEGSWQVGFRNKGQPEHPNSCPLSCQVFPEMTSLSRRGLAGEHKGISWYRTRKVKDD